MGYMARMGVYSGGKRTRYVGQVLSGGGMGWDRGG